MIAPNLSAFDRDLPPTKIMVYSHDAFGLGNIRRMLAICNYLLKSIPNLSILLISGSPMLQSLRMPQRLDYIKLPCLNRGESGNISVKYLNSDLKTIVNLRSELILTAAKNYQPDILLVDKKPYGIENEISPTIDYLKGYLKNTKIVLLLRDILDAPQKIINEWQNKDYYRGIESFYDRVLIVGMQVVFDLCAEYKFTKDIARKTDFCGYIRQEPGLKKRRILREELGISPKEKLVLITPGGGEDGYQLIDSYLEGLIKIENSTFHSLIFCGPEMPAKQQKQIQHKASFCSRVKILEFSDDLMSYIDAADLVVCMSGYNTICEVLSQKKLAIAVPRLKPSLEQIIRAKRMQELGWIETIHPQELTPKLLIDKVLEELEANNRLPKIPPIDLNGLSYLTEKISDLLPLGDREPIKMVL